MKVVRRDILKAAAGAALFAGMPNSSRAAGYPDRPVHMVIGYPPGLQPDVIARLVASGLSAELGQPVVVDNRPGAGTNLGTQIVIKAPADGYSILFLSVTTVAANASLYPELNFNFLHDIEPVANVCSYPLVLAANPSLPVKTLPDLIAYAKANPGKLNMASAGVGTAPHLFGELFNMMAGIKLVHVPYRGNFIPDLLGGQVQVAFGGISVFAPHFKSGKLLGLGVTSAKRSPALPDLPAIAEAVPGYEAIGWYGIGAPKGTPADIVAALNSKIDAAIAKPDLKMRLGALGFDSEPMAPAAFGALLAAETKKWAKVIKFAGIKAE